MKAIVFPGQGAQKIGMGKEVFDLFPQEIKAADDILGYSIKELCLSDPHENLNKTQFTQPALFIVESLTYKNMLDTGESIPDFVAGHSLGEYSALFAAGVIDFKTGVKLVQKRGALMGQAKGGGMAAIIGMSANDIEKVIKDNNLNTIKIANYNSPSQAIITGPKDDIVNAEKVFNSAGCKMFVILKVSGAFHSPFMQNAQDEFNSFIKAFQFKEMKIPVISNVTARPYKIKKIKELLTRQITESVQWTDTIRYLMGKGIENYIEVGPGNILTKLVDKIKNEATPLIDTIEKENEHDSKMTKTLGKTGGNGKNGTTLSAKELGSKSFKSRYGLDYAYVTGAMYHGIASAEMLISIGRSGMMGFLGAGGLSIDDIRSAIHNVRSALKKEDGFGVNLLYGSAESDLVDLLLRENVCNAEAAGFVEVTPSLVHYRVSGLKRDHQGNVNPKNNVIGKVSRPEIAKYFLSPPPQKILQKLLNQNKITDEEARLAQEIPLVSDLCVEADSGGHTDGGVAYVLMPAMIKLRDNAMKEHDYKQMIHVGAAGGIGTPHAAAAAFILGADFIVTGSINHCTVEAQTSPEVKALLQDIDVQDTDYAPAGDMFEMGAKVQVVRRGVFFPVRARKLFDIYTRYNSLNEIDPVTRKQIEGKFFQKSFEEIFNDCKEFYPPAKIQEAEKNEKIKMALVFRWYFGFSTRMALQGNLEQKVNWQVHSGPALGAFNKYYADTEFKNWENRKVDEIGYRLLSDTAEILHQKLKTYAN